MSAFLVTPNLVAPKPKRLQSPRTIWLQNGEIKSEAELWAFTEDPSLEVKRIFMDLVESHTPIKNPAKRKDSVAEPFSPTRYPSPPTRAQNPFEAETDADVEPEWDANHEVDMLVEDRAYPLFNEAIRSPPSDYDEHDPVVDNEESDHDDPITGNDEFEHDDEYEPDHGDADPPPHHPPCGDYPPHHPSFGDYPGEDNAEMYLAFPRVTSLAFGLQGPDDDLIYDGPHIVLQIATAPVTPCCKRKRGDIVSRSLPDIRFPDYPSSYYQRHPHPIYPEEENPIAPSSPKRSSSSSPYKSGGGTLSSYKSGGDTLSSTKATVSLLTSALLAHRGRHRRCRSSQLTLAGLAENVNEGLEGSGVISPTQRYRHTVS